MTAEQNFSIYTHLCSSDIDKPEPANETELESWHNERHEMVECVESNVNITTPTFMSIATSADIEEATVERLGAFQASDMCEWWTLDLTKRLCLLKESNESKIATNESVISGENFSLPEA